MGIPITEETARGLRSDIQELARATHHAARIGLLNCRQCWTISDLKDRWALGKDGVLSTLESHHVRHEGGGKGSPIIVPLAEVLRVEEEKGWGTWGAIRKMLEPAAPVSRMPAAKKRKVREAQVHEIGSS